MRRRRRPRGRQRRRDLKKAGPLPPATSAAKAVDEPSDIEAELGDEEEVWLSAVWRDTRAGARASRGFHFQDAVGAWLASRLSSGDLNADRLTPEGLDDLQLEGADPLQMEVKSRQNRLGPFPVGKAADHIAEAWIRHSDRFGDARRLVVLLERGLQGFEPTDRALVEIPLSQALAEVEGLRRALTTRLESRKRPAADMADLMADTTLIVASWDDILEDTARHITQVVSLPPAALDAVGHALRAEVAGAVDANAEAQYPDGAFLERTGLVESIQRIAELIDLQAIEYALSHGICSPVSKEALDTGDAFYEGMSTQPGHVAAGLVVPRPDLMVQATAALDQGKAVVFAGPSGVGKSAVLWGLPFAVPGVLWFCVQRVSEQDIPHLERLLRAHGASPNSPVGLLVDSAGRSGRQAWAELREAVSRIPGALLAGTARSEDLFSLGDLADCEVVTVSLDEAAAAVIHAGLVRRNATTAPHWREAFDQSGGLTLEFVHLLTRGTRLRDVLADQVAERAKDPSRSLELRALSCVAAADRWSASLPVEELQAFLGADPVLLSAALRRLVEEHLLVERDGILTGVHQLRSRALVDAIHEVPPPVLEDSVLSVLGMLHGQDLSRFAYEVLREAPQFEGAMLDAMEEVVRDDVERLLACLRAFELLDFYRQASVWADVLERRNVAASQRPFVMWMATTGSELPDPFPEEIRNALAEMLSQPKQSSTRESLLETAGLEGIATALADASSAESCQRLLKALRHTSADWTPLLPALKPSTALTAFLQDCPFDVLGECVSAARDVSREFAQAFASAAGGTDKLIQRLRTFDPWIRELRIDPVDGDLVGVVRFLFVSESDQGDPGERSVELGRLLLRAFPDIARVDVKPLLSGGRILENEGQEYHSSRLAREYDHPPSVVAWNRERVQLAQTLFGASETERLAAVGPLLADAAELLRDFGNVFVGGSVSGQAPELGERILALLQRGHQVPPPTIATPMDSDPRLQEEWSPLGDNLSVLIVDICDKVLPRVPEAATYAALSAFINQSVLGRDVPAVRTQPWHLLGLHEPPDALDHIVSALLDIDAVVTELHANPESARGIVSAGSSGPSDRALARAADWARRQTRRRLHARRGKVEAQLRSIGLAVDVHWFDGDPLNGKPSNFAVSVPVEAMDEWFGASEELVAKVEDIRELGEMPLLVPVLRGRSVRLYARRLASGLHPVTDFEEFGQVLPDSLDEQLTGRVVASIAALKQCSALSVLGHERELDEQMVQALEDATSAYQRAVTAISGLPDDAVVTATVDFLEGVAGRIEEEWRDESKAGAFAEGMAEMMLGGTSDEAIPVEGALILSVQWDADHVSATAMFESLEEEPSGVEVEEPDPSSGEGVQT
ncbi:MAG: hypothetical protein F4Y50_12550 [Dehalococcoidia bacterium]|nr:hypothetical protein [Dehalococcoidia bacterium]